ncbi:hypothetical protein GL263_05465 [Streptomyces durbertensis]|uniref:Secreted protein n=1 Tax=Streptomyces durbertensis TaxID=2448886 RepID=A0ABR6EDI1_9ACTN|nr:hypothetical protein [Streptomyces durbertensis]MBB1243015.1 hypothetical protein [Streptomyces durbertensis]
MSAAIVRRAASCLPLAVLLTVAPLGAAAHAAPVDRSAAPTASSAAGHKAGAVGKKKRPPVQRCAALGVNPAGTWKGTISLEHGDIEVYVAFTRDGRVSVPHTPGVVAEGTWWCTGRNTFSYKVIEKYYAPDGAYEGYGDIKVDASQRNDVIKAKGHTTMYTADGELIGEAGGSFVLRRISSTHRTDHRAGH